MGSKNPGCQQEHGATGRRPPHGNIKYAPLPTLPRFLKEPPSPLGIAPPPRTHPQIECKERTSELTAFVAKEKKGFEESLRRFQEKGAALRAALETAQKAATRNVTALKDKHQVDRYNGGGSGAAMGGVQHSNTYFIGCANCVCSLRKVSPLYVAKCGAVGWNLQVDLKGKRVYKAVIQSSDSNVVRCRLPAHTPFQPAGAEMQRTLSRTRICTRSHVSLLSPTRRSPGVIGWQVELEEAVRKGNEKFHTMITEQLMAQEDIGRAAEAKAKVNKWPYR